LCTPLPTSVQKLKTELLEEQLQLLQMKGELRIQALMAQIDALQALDPLEGDDEDEEENEAEQEEGDVGSGDLPANGGGRRVPRHHSSIVVDEVEAMAASLGPVLAVDPNMDDAALGDLIASRLAELVRQTRQRPVDVFVDPILTHLSYLRWKFIHAWGLLTLFFNILSVWMLARDDCHSTQLRDPQLRDRSSLLAELDPELDTSDLAAQVAQMEKSEATAAAAAAAALLSDPEIAAAAKP
jgi:hypothetical protein